MSETNDKRIDSNGDLDCSQLYRHTVPLFEFDRRRPILRGSGVVVSVDQKHFVISAAHVFESGFSDLGFGYPSPEGFRVFGARGLKIFVARAQDGAGNPKRAVYKDGLDLAIIEPVEEVLESLQSHYHFFDLRLSSYSPLAKWAVVSGWPAKKNIYDARKRVCKFQHCYAVQCPFVEIDRLRAAGWNPDTFFGLSANKEKDFASAISGARVHLPKLDGMSGGGLWVRSSTNSVTPDGDWRLAGIVVEDDEQLRMLKAIKVQQVWTPLFQAWGLSP